MQTNNSPLPSRPASLAMRLAQFAITTTILLAGGYFLFDLLGAMDHWWPEDALTGPLIHLLTGFVLYTVLAGSHVLVMLGMDAHVAIAVVAHAFAFVMIGIMVYLVFRFFSKYRWGEALLITVLAMITVAAVGGFNLLSDGKFNHPALWVAAMAVSISVAIGITMLNIRLNKKNP